jgi:hypothetical protein
LRPPKSQLPHIAKSNPSECPSGITVHLLQEGNKPAQYEKIIKTIKKRSLEEDMKRIQSFQWFISKVAKRSISWQKTLSVDSMDLLKEV